MTARPQSKPVLDLGDRFYAEAMRIFLDYQKRPNSDLGLALDLAGKIDQHFNPTNFHVHRPEIKEPANVNLAVKVLNRLHAEFSECSTVRDAVASLFCLCTHYFTEQQLRDLSKLYPEQVAVIRCCIDQKARSVASQRNVHH